MADPRPRAVFSRRSALAAGAALLGGGILRKAAGPASAAAVAPQEASCLPPPEDRVILRLSGAITQHNAEGSALFDDAMLGDLPQRSFRTSSIWTPAPRVFSGPSLHDLIACVGGTEARWVVASAANAYASRLALDTLKPHAPIVARRIDEQPFGLRERGPLWLMYPFDDEPRFRSETIYAHCVWHLNRLTLESG